MAEEQLTLKKAIELNQLDKFARQQESWLAEKGYDLPHTETHFLTLPRDGQGTPRQQPDQCAFSEALAVASYPASG